jgi:hypothetical protein
MKVRLPFCLLFLMLLVSCALPRSRSEVSPEKERYLRLQALIGRIGSSGFAPDEGERVYSFTYALRMAEGGEVVRQGDGFVLVKDPLWCLVRRWRDPTNGNPGQRILIVDRNQRKFEAEVRQWPEGSLQQRWNQWSCIRFSHPLVDRLDLYDCEYFYTEGTERVIQNAENWVFYEAFSWNENGLLERIARFSNSFVHYSYEGLKVNRIEFGRERTISAFVELTYD